MHQLFAFAIILAEFRRALAAARRYDELRYGAAGPGRVAPGEIPGRVFEEFYAREDEAGQAALEPAPPLSIPHRQAIADRGPT
jgi:hypothetical protein